MLTLVCIVVTIGSLWFVGIPVTLLLSEPHDDNEMLWIAAPFIGLAAVILFLQNLAYLDVPIRHSTHWLWGLVFFLWIWLIKSKRLKIFFQDIPYHLLLSAVGIYMIQGMGLLLVGAKYYVGRAWHDQFNYVATAQFLLDLPFSSSFKDVAGSPYLFRAVSNKCDRIGQSVFHAFIAVSSFTNAKSVFEPVILLAPFLSALAVYWLARKLSLSKWSSTMAALASGLLPSLAMVHLECFLSQALAIPLLLAWPALITEAIDRLSGKWLLISSLILAAAASIYTEFYIIFLGIIVLVIFARGFSRDKRTFLRIGLGSVLVLTALIMNPGYIRAIGVILGRIALPNVLRGIYPWAFSLEGLTRLWLGDFGAGLLTPWPQLLGLISLSLIFMACCGICLIMMRRRFNTVVENFYGLYQI